MRDEKSAEVKRKYGLVMKKNEIVRVKIEDMGVNGEGIGHVNGFTLFVKDALIGDDALVQVVKVKKGYGYARLHKLENPSKDRVEAVCPIARPCGGCQIQEMAYGQQLAFKAGKVRQNMERIGKVPSNLLDQVTEPIIGMEDPWHYRNKAQFPFGKNRDGKIVCGFYAGRTHSIIETTDCPIGIKENKVILETILTFMREYHVEPYNEETGGGIVRHALIRAGFYTKELMVCLVINAKKLPHKDILVERLSQIENMKSICVSRNEKRTNVIMGETYEVLWGQDHIKDRIGENTYRISPLSFYQVNPVQTEKLYATALEYAGLTGKETVWDLYCGIGTISLFLARKAKKVYGVEIIEQAIRDANENARENNIGNVRFFVGKAEEVLPDYVKRQREEAGIDERTDVIVVDPPRKGLEESLIDTIVNMTPERIVYVSCDSATLARDVKLFREKEYEIRKIRLVDQFCHGVHVESVVLMTRVAPTK